MRAVPAAQGRKRGEKKEDLVGLRAIDNCGEDTDLGGRRRW